MAVFMAHFGTVVEFALPFLFAATARADQAIYQYEGDVPPHDPSEG